MVDEFDWFFKIGVVLIVVAGKSEKAIDVLAKAFGTYMLLGWMCLNLHKFTFPFVKPYLDQIKVFLGTNT